MNPYQCPYCYKPVAPIFAIPEEAVKQIGPFEMAVNVIPKLLSEQTIIVDMAYCENGHGLVKIQYPKDKLY